MLIESVAHYLLANVSSSLALLCLSLSLATFLHFSCLLLLNTFRCAFCWGCQHASKSSVDPTTVLWKANTNRNNGKFIRQPAACWSKAASKWRSFHIEMSCVHICECQTCWFSANMFATTLYTLQTVSHGGSDLSNQPLWLFFLSAVFFRSPKAVAVCQKAYLQMALG